jgi:hypothetical protein
MPCRCHGHYYSNRILRLDRSTALEIQSVAMGAYLLLDDQKADKARQTPLLLAALTTAEKGRWGNLWNVMSLGLCRSTRRLNHG